MPHQSQQSRVNFLCCPTPCAITASHMLPSHQLHILSLSLMGCATPEPATKSPFLVLSHTLCKHCLSLASLSPSPHHFPLPDGLCHTIASNQESLPSVVPHPLPPLPPPSHQLHIISLSLMGCATPEPAIKSTFLVLSQTLCNHCLSPAPLSPASHHFPLPDGLCHTPTNNI